MEEINVTHIIVNVSPDDEWIDKLLRTEGSKNYEAIKGAYTTALYDRTKRRIRMFSFQKLNFMHNSELINGKPKICNKVPFDILHCYHFG